METLNSFIATSEKIQSLAKLILNQWENDVRRSLEDHKKENKIILLDHMPEILKSLASTLATGQRDDMELARAHGFQRAILTHFTIEDILNEYALLRDTLITYIYPIGDLDCVKFVHWYIDSLTKYSVIEFINNLQLSSRVVLNDNVTAPELKPLS